MHTIKLEMTDSAYSHIMFLLNNLNSKELKIIEETQSSKDNFPSNEDEIESKMFSQHSANLIDEWKDVSEDEVWN